MNFRNMVNHYRWYGVLGVAALALVLGAGCGRAPAAANQAGPPVQIAVATSGDVPLYIDEIGRTTAREMVAIRPQVSGQITGIHFKDGADLHKGDLLFKIDPRPYQASLDQAKASWASAKASLQLANDDWARYQSLDPRSISRSDYDAKKNAVAVDEALVEAGSASIETAAVNLDYCTIRSPIDGLAGQRLVDMGNVVTANSDTVLLTIQRMDPIYADFTVNENDLTQVRNYLAKGTLKVEVRSPTDPDHPRDGDLTFLDNAVQDGTGTVKLRGTMGNADRKFWPGQFVNVRLVLQVLKNAVLVPASAIQLAQTGSYVYVVKDDGTAEPRPVEVGQRQGEEVVIAKGVSEGEKVVTMGQMLVIPGKAVTIVPTPETAAAPESAPGAGAAPTTTTAGAAPSTAPAGS
jgi:multidrug efflux system membrane fusion protein